MDANKKLPYLYYKAPIRRIDSSLLKKEAMGLKMLHMRIWNRPLKKEIEQHTAASQIWHKPFWNSKEVYVVEA